MPSRKPSPASSVQPAAPARSSATLADIAAEQPADVREIIPLFLRILEQLLTLQNAGARLGLSPRRVRLRPGGAVEIEPAPAISAQQTIAAEPKYCPPEMFRAQPASEGDRPATADIYVLGFILYEVLLGTRLFGQQFAELGPEPAAFQWMRWHADLQQQLRPLSALLPGIPKPVSDLVQRMTDKDPNRRISKLEDVRDRLRTIATAYVETSPAPQRPSSPGRKRSVAKAVGVISAFLMLGAFAWLALPFIRSGVSGGAQAERYPATLETSTGTMLLFSRPADSAGAATPWFYIDKYEITNWQYKKFCEATGHVCGGGPGWDAAYFGKLEYPVRNISAADFAAYARWAGKRVPAPAEVTAARARFDRRLYPWDSPPASNDVVGHRCAADPPEALKLRHRSSSWQFWRKPN